MKFMQTPDSHPDVYAATAHRMFFKNLRDGKQPQQCPDNDGHNVDTIDALTVTVPVIIKYVDADRELRNKKVLEAIHVTRNVKSLHPFAIAFSDALVSVIHGKELRDVVNQTAMKLGMKDLKTLIHNDDPMVACYISSSFPAMLFMAYKYADSVEKTLLFNANAGGENVARGALLGTLIGAYHGINGFPEWAVTGLRDKDAISGEIDQILS